MNQPVALSFQITYPLLDLKLSKVEPIKYQFGIYAMQLKELKKGYKASKVSKAMRKGTSVQYELIAGAEEFNQVKNDLLGECNNLFRDLIEEEKD